MTQATNLFCWNLRMFFSYLASSLPALLVLQHDRRWLFSFLFLKTLLNSMLVFWNTPNTEAGIKKWKKVLNRWGHFKMNISTKICSNCSAADHCSSECRIPKIFLKDYDVPCSSKSLLPRKKLSGTQEFFKV